MEDFIWYRYVLKDGTTEKILAENIVEAMEMLIRIQRIHPTSITKIEEI